MTDRVAVGGGVIVAVAVSSSDTVLDTVWDTVGVGGGVAVAVTDAASVTVTDVDCVAELDCDVDCDVELETVAVAVTDLLDVVDAELLGVAD